MFVVQCNCSVYEVFLSPNIPNSLREEQNAFYLLGGCKVQKIPRQGSGLQSLLTIDPLLTCVRFNYTKGIRLIDFFKCIFLTSNGFDIVRLWVNGRKEMNVEAWINYRCINVTSGYRK